VRSPLALRISIVLNLVGLIGFGWLIYSVAATPPLDLADVAYHDTYYVVAKSHVLVAFAVPLIALSVGIALQLLALRRAGIHSDVDGSAR
jgi:heme/copper-type cytochrome/quinol oxidase subunit 1